MSGDLVVPGDDDIAAAMAEAAQLGEQAAQMTQAASSGGELVPAGSHDAEHTRAAMIEARQQSAAVAAKMRIARRKAMDAIEAQKRELNARVEEMTKALEPLERHMKRMQEGIWSLSLYLGVGEDLVTLADGEPAPAGTPIHVRQGVLAMDEECAVAADSGGIDYTRVATFDGWITASPERIEQLIPEQRGVVAIMPRRSSKDYGGGMADMAGNAANHQTYLLIRNGKALYRYIAKDFEAGRRLTPRRDEFTKLFVERRYNFKTSGHDEVALEPGTAAWERAEQAAGAVERHFMRVALILQGLIARTMCFAPLPAEDISLLSMASYEAGHIVLVGDDENALSTGRPPFRQWLAERNAKLRPGMRITGNFRCTAWHDASTHDRDSWGHSRIHPNNASHPVTGEIYRIERREGSALVFLYQRTDEVYRDDVPYPDKPGYVYSAPMPTAPKIRASARIHPDDEFIIPLDLVTIEECEAYLRSRTDRHNYVDMFPVLRAAIAALSAEAAAEAPMRQLVAACIVRDHEVSFEEAETAAAELITWWKLGNRWHRPLVMREDPAAESKAIAAISAEFGARLRAVTGTDEAQTVQALREQVPGAMVVARKKDGTWIVLEPQPRTVPGESLRIWVREHTWTPGLRRHETTDWVLPEPARIARWRMLWTSEAWQAWDLSASRSDHLTDPEIADMVTWASAQAVGQADAGHAIALAHLSSRGWRLYWLDLADTDSTVSGHELPVTWRRTGARAPVFEHGRLYPDRWHHRPWPDGPADHLAWSDEAAVAVLDERLKRGERIRDTDRAARNKARAACQEVGRQWEQRAREQAQAEFITRYGDADLWEEHAASKRWDCPHLSGGRRGWAGDENSWEEAAVWLTRRERDFAGMTVAEMAEMYETLSGEHIEIPDDLSGLRFAAKEQSGGHGTGS